MANGALVFLAIPIAIGLLLVYFSIRSTVQDGIASISIDPGLFVAGILIAVIGGLLATKLAE
jgi:hypothetical protein